MKSKSFMLMVLSMGFGLIAAIGISQVMGSKGNSQPAVKMGPVLVANDHMDHKTELSEENCRIENWPLSLIPEGAATDMAEVNGKFITTRLRKGQALITVDIKDKSEIVDLAIPPGHKVINVKVPPEDAMGGLLSPGAKVDIIGVFPVRNGNTNTNRSETRTFLKAIRVFNVNGSTTSHQHQEGQSKGSASAIVGVIVTERQAEKIVWVKKEGDIRLALRGEEDLESGEEDEEDEFWDFLNKDKPQQGITFESPTNRSSDTPETSFTTVIYQGSGIEKISFDDEGNQIGVQVTESGGGSSYRAPSGGSQGSSADYEESDDSEDIDNQNENDQYRGE